MPRYRGSYGAYLEVRTQAPGRQDLFDPGKLGDSDETLSERVAKCLDGDLRADQSLEPEAVCDGTGPACNARWHSLEQIGRASCRERVYVSVVGGALNTRENARTHTKVGG